MRRFEEVCRRLFCHSCSGTRLGQHVSRPAGIPAKLLRRVLPLQGESEERRVGFQGLFVCIFFCGAEESHVFLLRSNMRAICVKTLSELLVGLHAHDDGLRAGCGSCRLLRFGEKEMDVHARRVGGVCACGGRRGDRSSSRGRGSGLGRRGCLSLLRRCRLPWRSRHRFDR